MVDVSELARFAPGERTMRLVMDIAAALERYRIAMEGPSGVRLRRFHARYDPSDADGKRRAARW